jgi:ATP-dependent RNA helicase RhlE
MIVIMENTEVISTFADFKFNKQINDSVAELGYETPTEIQQKAIPKIMEGHDILGIAQTGTGKTAAYVLPLLMKVKYAQGNHPRALILAPTRELAIQIDENLHKLGKNLDLRYACVYGGTGMQSQIKQIQSGIDIVVATPGRMMDIYLKGELILKEIKYLVLDEADKMMDMGFMPQIRKILEVIPRKRQNLLFSATFPEKVERLSGEFLEFPVKVEVTPQATTAETVEQVIYEVPNLKTKINLLEMLLHHTSFSRVLVFCRTRQTAENTFKYLQRKFKEDEIRVIHANKGQNTRINSMEAFREGIVKVLVATDVAARGIDVSQISHVINFDVPLVYEDYVHRIGRTGRANHEGMAITFVNMAEKYYIEKIQSLIRQQIPVKQLPAGLEIEDTPFEEKQAMLIEIDQQKRKENPDFQGAFHEKKNKKGVLQKKKPLKTGSKDKNSKKTGKKFKGS